MLKNIYIHIGHLGAIFPIRQFCKQYPDILEKNNLHYIEYSKLFPLDTPINFNEFLYSDTWIIGDKINQLDTLNLLPFSAIISQVQQYIIQNQIENLVITLSFKDIEHCLPELISLRKIFSTTQFHIQEHTIDSIRDCNCMANIRMLFAKAQAYPINFHTFISSVNLLDINYIQNNPCTYYLNKLFNLTIDQTIFQNEKDVFYSWLKFINLTLPASINFIPHATFSPEVISYLIALFDNFTQEQGISFDQEIEFLNSFSEHTTSFSYHSSYQQDDIHTFFPSKQPNESNNFSIDCSKTPLRINLNTAIKLSKRLSPTIRKQLLTNLNFEQLKYTTNTNKAIYTSLLLAEQKISHEQANKITQPTCGRVTFNEISYSEKPIITILTLSYNHEKYISQCIESILNQKTKYSFKHIILDYGSTDNTKQIIIEYANKYPHIEAIFKTFNISDINYYNAINNIETEYLAICDGDDFYIDEKKLEEQVSFLEKNPQSNICFGSAYIFYEDIKTITSIYPNSLPDFKEKNFYYTSNIILNNLMQSSSIMYRWLNPKGIPPYYPLLIRPFDWATTIFHSYNSKIGFINKPMSIYRRHKAAYFNRSPQEIIITRIFWELSFCYHLDLCTEKKYTKLFMQKVFMILSTFYFSDTKTEIDPVKYQALKNRIEKCFPEYIKLFHTYVTNQI